MIDGSIAYMIKKCTSKDSGLKSRRNENIQLDLAFQQIHFLETVSWEVVCSGGF